MGTHHKFASIEKRENKQAPCCCVLLFICVKTRMLTLKSQQKKGSQGVEAKYERRMTTDQVTVVNGVFRKAIGWLLK
jgi:hypothetical protein